MGGVVWSKHNKGSANQNEAAAVPLSEQHENLTQQNSESDSEPSHSADAGPHSGTSVDDFEATLQRKREERRLALARISAKMDSLQRSQEELQQERKLRTALEKQVTALKEVSVINNEIIQTRESQVVELKKYLQTVESSAEESLTMLRAQYEIQIENTRKLRQLYEERSEAVARSHQKEIERERARNMLLELKLERYTNEPPTKDQLKEQIEQLEKRLNDKQQEIDALKEDRVSVLAACNNLTSQLTLVNNLFSNLLTGNMDFDFLTQLLQDNHNLITDLIANGDINDTVALLVNIAEKAYKKDDQPKEAADSSAVLNIKEEIALNLPKVWRMLLELLNSHENACQTVTGTSEECFKHVETPSGGSRTVISVSQTFLRLKDLILEKNCLVKEVGRLKTLNGHLENRLELQEKRLGVVTSELRKTWGVVSKLKVQHRQLHTNEKVLRYELQHKRHMLTDLKHELECCKETWDKVRVKNTQTEHDWELLRKEFALRKSRDASNSAESGYEDDESSQSPDLSSSDLEYDISPPSNDPHCAAAELDGELAEDAASDATVIELIDMLDLDQDDTSIQTGCSDDNDDNDDAVPTSSSVESTATDKSAESNAEPQAAARTSEEILNARAARLRRLEQQCRSLLNQMAITSLRSDTLSTRLEELHEQYGSEERRLHPRQDSFESETINDASPQAENAGSASSSESVTDERSCRVQKMEEKCMQILEHVTPNGPELQLESISDFEHGEEQRGRNEDQSVAEISSTIGADEETMQQ